MWYRKFLFMNSRLTLVFFRPLAVFALFAVAAGITRAETEASTYRFAFGANKPTGDWLPVSPETNYTKQLGYGFEPGAGITVSTTKESGDPAHTAVLSDHPFYFSARVPAEGNYRVKVTLGSETVASTTTIKAELRRLMVEEIKTTAGQFKTVEFIVNTRTPKITPSGNIAAGEVKLKAPRETTKEAWAWDDLITLEFNGAHPAVSRIEIAPAQVPTIFLLGDSTVCDQSGEPYASWGQMVTRFFKPEVGVANHAESGETYRDSIDRRRLDKILSVMKPGDYLLMQFGHNDQKQIAAGKGGPFTTYKEEIKKHVDAVRAHGGIPVIISPMERNSFTDDGKIHPTLADYAEACRQSAKELDVAFVDLNALSIPFYESLGKDRAYLAFAGTGTKRDATHHDNYGAYELAKCVVLGLKTAGLPLAKFVSDDFGDFHPAHPDAVDTFALPASPQFTNQRPLGD
jgi:lysophospholipase L1-like esterase